MRASCIRIPPLCPFRARRVRFDARFPTVKIYTKITLNIKKNKHSHTRARVCAQAEPRRSAHSYVYATETGPEKAIPNEKEKERNTRRRRRRRREPQSHLPYTPARVWGAFGLLRTRRENPHTKQTHTYVFRIIILNLVRNTRTRARATRSVRTIIGLSVGPRAVAVRWWCGAAMILSAMRSNLNIPQAHIRLRSAFGLGLEAAPHAGTPAIRNNF